MSSEKLLAQKAELRCMLRKRVVQLTLEAQPNVGVPSKRSSALCAEWVTFLTDEHRADQGGKFERENAPRVLIPPMF